MFVYSRRPLATILRYSLTTDISWQGNGGNKLRTYKLFESEFEVEEYCKILLPLKHRSHLQRLGAALARLG